MHVKAYAGAANFFSSGGCVEVFYMEQHECEAWKTGLMVLDSQGTISRTDGEPIDSANYKTSRGAGYTSESPCA